MLKNSPYYLLYAQHAHVSSGNNLFWHLEIVVTTKTKYRKKIADFWETWLIANKALFERAIKDKEIRKGRVKKVSW